MKTITNFKIKHQFDEHYDRFEQICQRGKDANLDKVSPDLKEIMIYAGAAIASYLKTAKLTDELYSIGGPDHIPDEIEEHMTKTLNKLDDIMTLEISALS